MKQILISLFSFSLFFVPAIAGHHPSRCGTRQKLAVYKYAIPSDCGEGHTSVKNEYEPGDIFYIPVVFHVMYKADGTGRISEERIKEQIRHLNEDYRAIAGSKGDAGYDCGIEFYLADEDPQGNSSTGITFTQNDRWFEDATDEVRAEYGKALGWNPKKYLNIFTTEGVEYLGYVVNMPWMGGANPDEEGVVLAYFAVGDSEAYGETYSGQTATHEIGHYLGLMHTFGWGTGDCPTGNCYEDGDWICDTESHPSPNWECTETTSCDSRDPIHNYMNYTGDSCMTRFTMEQANRMRCSLINYRSELIQQGGSTPAQSYTRWIPHVTRNGGGFKTTLMIQNTSGSTASLFLHPFDSNGTEGTAVEIKLNAHEILARNMAQMFSSQPSHVGLSGGKDCVVTMGYRDDKGSGATAHIPENNTLTRSFSFYPGESSVFDGIALINTGSSQCGITLETLDRIGNVITRKTLSSNLAPGGKFMTTLDDLNLSDSEVMVRVTTTQEVLPLLLRGSRPGTTPAFLYQTLPNLN